MIKDSFKAIYKLNVLWTVDKVHKASPPPPQTILYYYRHIHFGALYVQISCFFTNSLSIWFSVQNVRFKTNFDEDWYLWVFLRSWNTPIKSNYSKILLLND